MLDIAIFYEEVRELSAFFGKSLGETAMNAFYETLKTLTDKEFQEAIGQAYRQSSHMPNAKQLFEFAKGTPEQRTAAYQVVGQQGDYASLRSGSSQPLLGGSGGESYVSYTQDLLGLFKAKFDPSLGNFRNWHLARLRCLWEQASRFERADWQKRAIEEGREIGISEEEIMAGFGVAREKRVSCGNLINR